MIVSESEATVRDYILTIQTVKGNRQRRWDVGTFNEWVREQGETIGPNFETRLDQFRRYTGQNVVDWEMVED